MALGDRSAHGKGLEAGPLLTVFEARLADLGPCETWADIWERRAFRRIRDKPSSSGDVPPPVNVSLRWVVQNVTDRLTHGSARDGETVEVAFQSLVLVSGMPGPCAPDGIIPPEGDLADLAEQECEGFFDPTLGFAAILGGRMELNSTSSTGDDQRMRIMLGRGVFAPRAGQERHQIGGLVYTPLTVTGAPDLEGVAVEPTLADPKKRTGLPAAVYHGQTALAFGLSPCMAPAWIDFGRAHPDEQQFEGGVDTDGDPLLMELAANPAFGTKREVSARAGKAIGAPGDEGDAADREWPFELEINGTCSCARPSVTQIVPVGEATASWKIRFNRAAGEQQEVSARGRLDLVLDRRAARLRPRRIPREQELERTVIGLRFPPKALEATGSRAWVNIDAGGYPCVSTLQRSEQSAVIQRRRGRLELRIFTWRNRLFSRNYDTTPFRLEEDGHSVSLRREAHQNVDGNDTATSGFGCVVLPPAGECLHYQQGAGALLDWCCDWLDVAAQIETPDGTTGLAAAWAKAAGRADMSLGLSDPAGKAFGPFVFSYDAD